MRVYTGKLIAKKGLRSRWFNEAASIFGMVGYLYNSAGTTQTKFSIK
jgi:hypothetical protein